MFFSELWDWYLRVCACMTSTACWPDKSKVAEYNCCRALLHTARQKKQALELNLRSRTPCGANVLRLRISQVNAVTKKLVQQSVLDCAAVASVNPYSRKQRPTTGCVFLMCDLYTRRTYERIQNLTDGRLLLPFSTFSDHIFLSITSGNSGKARKKEAQECRLKSQCCQKNSSFRRISGFVRPHPESNTTLVF